MLTTSVESVVVAVALEASSVVGSVESVMVKLSDGELVSGVVTMSSIVVGKVGVVVSPGVVCRGVVVSMLLGGLVT